MNVFKIAIMHVSRMLKQKTPIFTVLLIPTMIVCIIAYFMVRSEQKPDGVYSSPITLSIVNEDEGNLSKELIKELELNKNFKINYCDKEKAENNIKKDKVAVALIINKKFTNNLNDNKAPKVDVLKTTDGNMNLIVEKDINKYITKKLLGGKISGIIKENKVNLNVSYENFQDNINVAMNEEKVRVSIDNLKNDKKDNLSTGMVSRFILNFLMYSMIYIVSEICELKNNRTLKRSFSTPNKNSVILGAVLLSMFILCSIQLLMMVGLSAYVFKVNFGRSILAVIFTFMIFTITNLCMGIMISRWAKNQGQVSGLVNLIVTPTCIISGSFMPIEFLPVVFQKLSYFTPQKWAIDALNNIALNGAGIIDILPQMGILILFAIAFFTAGARALHEIVET